jgi:hypothetical protein
VEEKLGKRITSTTQLGEQDLDKIAGVVSRLSKKA